jgi:beta-glucosidase
MAMRQQLQDRLPVFTEAEFNLLREAEVNFYGMNYYTSLFAQHRVSPASDTDHLGNLDEYQVNNSGVPIGDLSGVDWLRSAPQGFQKHLVRIYSKYRKPIYITENGCPCPSEDKITREESVQDAYHQKYLSDHLDAITRAIQDGAKVAGYFIWSLMDNFGEYSQILPLLKTIFSS